MESTEKKPRGKRGQGCIYLRGRTYWVKFSANGVAYQEPADTESKKEATDFLKARILAHANGDVVLDAKRVTVASLYEALIAEYKNQRQDAEWAEGRWTTHLESFFGGMRAADVGTDTLNRYIELRREEKAANGTINRELSLLQRAFMLGYESQPRKVARPLRFHRLPESKPRMGFIEAKQYAALAANCSGFMRTMLCLSYSFGFRKSELLSLRVSDVNLTAGTLQLRDSKNGEARKVSLTQDAKNLLAACCHGKAGDVHVFTRGKGTKAVADFRATWDKITLAAECSGLLFHDLRRSAVRNMVRGGIPETVAMKISGHKTRNVFDRYNITSERDLADAARKIELSYTQATLPENADVSPVEEKAENVILQ